MRNRTPLALSWAEKDAWWSLIKTLRAPLGLSGAGWAGGANDHLVVQAERRQVTRVVGTAFTEETVFVCVSRQPGPDRTRGNDGLGTKPSAQRRQTLRCG